MPWQLTDDFPHRLSDDALAEAVEGLTAIVHHRYGEAVPVATWRPELQLALLQAALQEQSRRLADRANEGSRRATRLSIAVAALALLIALTSTILDYRGDQSWHEEQIRLLTEIRDRLPEP